jgi:hypothetical protein
MRPSGCVHRDGRVHGVHETLNRAEKGPAIGAPRRAPAPLRRAHAHTPIRARALTHARAHTHAHKPTHTRALRHTHLNTGERTCRLHKPQWPSPVESTAATSAPGLAAPPPHLHRDCASSGLSRSFRRAYLSLELRTAPCHASIAVAICSTSADASGPSFTPSTTYIAATTAPPPPFQFDSDGRPTVLTIHAVPPSDPNGASSSLSSDVTVRRQCALGPGTDSQTGRERRTSRMH